MSVGSTTMVSMNELENQIRLARLALAEAKRVEEENGYDDALLSMDRSYCEGSLDSLEFVYTLMNGHEYSGE